MYADTEASVRVGLSAGEEQSGSMFTLKYAMAHYARKNHTQTHTGCWSPCSHRTLERDCAAGVQHFKLEKSFQIAQYARAHYARKICSIISQHSKISPHSHWFLFPV